MKKIGLICLALVLALGVLGVGYAMWDKTLTITGTVSTTRHSTTRPPPIRIRRPVGVFMNERNFMTE